MRLLRSRWWWISGAVTGAGAGLERLAGGDAGVWAGLLSALGDLFTLWVLVTVLVGFVALWRRLTYRIGVRLFLSYVLIGLSPFVFMSLIGVAALYMAMGQYTSVRWADRSQLVMDRLERRCRRACTLGQRYGEAAMLQALEEVRKAPPEPLVRVEWVARLSGRELRSEGAPDFPVPEWVGEGPTLFHAASGTVDMACVAFRRGPDLVMFVTPFDDETARSFNRTGWYDVAFLMLEEPPGGRRRPGTITVTEGRAEGAPKLIVAGREVDVADVWGPWDLPPDAPFLEEPTIVWFRRGGALVDPATGRPEGDVTFMALLRTSPANAWRDFVRSRYALGEHIVKGLAAMAAMLGFLYVMVVGVAVLMILAITRSVSRLSRGAREVARGNVGYRIPVKRRDQLGDLAHAFNTMAASVERMLEEVREKERLAHEMELARQIQESLLPERRLSFRGLELEAAFLPATEVGGDYFDVIPLRDGKLVVAVGDVAGHGLSTGLFMASVKALVGALVSEGHRGAALLDRANRLLMAGTTSRTMVTLAVVELDPGASVARLTNAGHPPPLLVGPDGGVRELSIPSAPLGSRLCRPRDLEVSWEPGSLLVLYSDGLVEAAGPDGAPLGYDRLPLILARAAGRRPREVLELLEEELRRHSAGRPLRDDVTVVVVGLGGGGSGASAGPLPGD